MLLFIFTVMIEMIVCAFRGTKKNFLRLFCNLASAAAAAGITYLCHLIYSRTFGDLTGADLTLEGNLTEETASAVDTIITSFAKGIALSVIFVVLYLLLKYVSLLIVKITVKDKAQRGFKPLGLLFGLVIGIICAGFVLMPLTGLQQVFPDRKTAIKVSDFISENVDEPTGKFVRFFSGPTAQVICKYTGIGLLTNEMFNFLTTAETDSGKECLAEFLPPYFEALDEVKVIMDEDELLSAKIGCLQHKPNILDGMSRIHVLTQNLWKKGIVFPQDHFVHHIVCIYKMCQNILGIFPYQTTKLSRILFIQLLCRKTKFLGGVGHDHRDSMGAIAVGKRVGQRFEGIARDDV